MQGYSVLCMSRKEKHSFRAKIKRRPLHVEHCRMQSNATERKITEQWEIKITRAALQNSEHANGKTCKRFRKGHYGSLQSIK